MSRSDDGHHFPGPGTLDRALALVRFLRRACAWDAAQTAESLIPHLLEETHEVVDAIRSGEEGALEGELGDLLLNLAFQIVVAEEAGRIDADSVYGRLEAKMIARHPHVFGDAEHRDWEAVKAQERAGSGEGALAGLAAGLDPLTRAFRMQERAAGVGFDWDDTRGPLAKVEEELREVEQAIGSAGSDPGSARPAGSAGSQAADQITEEVGDLLFAVVNLARLARVHPTTALARANRKFRTRFERLEEIAAQRGIDIGSESLDVLDGIWDEVKEEESSVD